jgi:hypothetical protein
MSLNVPPWEALHELSDSELRTTNLVTTDAVAEVLPKFGTAEKTAKPVQDRFETSVVEVKANSPSATSAKTADAIVPTGGVAATDAK